MAVIGEVAVNLVARTERLERGLMRSQKAVSSFVGKVASVAAGVIAFDRIARAVAGSVQGFADAQTKAESLRAALANNGAATAFEQLAESAAKLQRATTQDADDLVGVMAKIASTTKASADEVESLTTAAVGLAKVLKTDTASAADLLTKAANGNAESLQRYGLNINEAASNQEQLNQVLQIASGGLNLATAETSTLNGVWEQAKNALGDVSESIGGQIAEWLNLQGILKQVGPFAANVGPLVSVGLSTIADTLDGIGAKLTAWAASMTGTFARITAVISTAGNTLYAMLVEPLKAAELLGKQVYLNIVNTAKIASEFTGIGDAQALARELEAAQDAVDEVLLRKGRDGQSFVSATAAGVATEQPFVQAAEEWGKFMSDGLLEGFAQRSAERQKSIENEFAKMEATAQKFGEKLPTIGTVIAKKGDKETKKRDGVGGIFDPFGGFRGRATFALERASFNGSGVGGAEGIVLEKQQVKELKEIKQTLRKVPFGGWYLG